jgi:hypothetical protein
VAEGRERASFHPARSAAGMNALLGCMNALLGCMNALPVCMNALLVCMNALLVCMNALPVCMNALPVCVNALLVCTNARRGGVNEQRPRPHAGRSTMNRAAAMFFFIGDVVQKSRELEYAAIVYARHRDVNMPPRTFISIFGGIRHCERLTPSSLRGAHRRGNPVRSTRREGAAG